MLSLSKLRNAGIALGVVGGVGQLAVAFMGNAIGGMSIVVILLTLDGLVAIAGAVVAARWRMPGSVLMLIGGVGAVVTLFGATLLEIWVAAFLLLAVAATVAPNSIRR